MFDVEHKVGTASVLHYFSSCMVTVVDPITLTGSAIDRL
ncbi:hypothetical protein RHOER0001_4516 [Rhodococcus erythropolis SK121]|nr:hypothetical protein RHOER0001_4516 [Rhodococcus erythropolis SK121]